MQIEFLKVFCDLTETGSFTKTAQINAVTQSAISQNISAMERAFGARLVERSKKHFQLTTEGQVVYDYGKRILQSHDALQNTIQEIQGVITGTIHLATDYSIGLYELPASLAQFSKDCPAVNMRVEYRPSNQVVEDVLGNVVHLGLVAFPEPHAKLEAVVFQKDRLVLACHPQHRLAKSKSVRLASLNGESFIGLEPEIPMRKALDKMLKDEGVKVKHVMEFNNMETVKRATELNHGVAILPERILAPQSHDHTLAAVRLQGDYTESLAVIYRKGEVLSPGMKHFITVLEKDTSQRN